MLSFNKLSKSQTLILAAIVGIVILVLFQRDRDNYTSGSSYSDIEEPLGNKMVSEEVTEQPKSMSNCEMKMGTGLASSLLPREIASQDDFGQFVPEDILSGQNFLDPKNIIGIPETMGGALRNANQQIRAEPPNSKNSYVWNNSTIVPDMMQRPLV